MKAVIEDEDYPVCLASIMLSQVMLALKLNFLECKIAQILTRLELSC